LAFVVSGWSQGAANTIRVGAFPNITHAQAVIGKANGWFDKALGPQVKVQWTSFNAGPSAIEALFAGAIDMSESLYAGFQDHSYWIAIRVSMQRVLIGYAISVVLGIILGLGVASNKFLEETMGGLLVSLQSLPSICWWPPALLWYGLNQNAILFVVITGSLLSVTLAMEDGRKQMPKIFGQAGRNLGAKGFKLFWYMLLPASLPFIVS
jgi:sulfonate transport system permease protein